MIKTIYKGFQVEFDSWAEARKFIDNSKAEKIEGKISKTRKGQHNFWEEFEVRRLMDSIERGENVSIAKDDSTLRSRHTKGAILSMYYNIKTNKTVRMLKGRDKPQKLMNDNIVSMINEFNRNRNVPVR